MYDVTGPEQCCQSVKEAVQEWHRSIPLDKLQPQSQIQEDRVTSGFVHRPDFGKGHKD